MNAAPLQMGATVPFKRLTTPSLGKMLQPEASATASLQVPYLKAGHVQWHGVELPEDLPMMWASAADVADLTPKPGDLLICEGGEVGRAAIAPSTLPEKTIIQNSLHLVRESNQACPRYLKYALEQVAASGWIDLVCNKATIAHLTVDKLRELPVPYWDKTGQERIANFLDVQTARIDALIAEKQQLQNRLGEYRRSLISSAITQGVPGKHKELVQHESLGMVPKGWVVGKFRHYVQVRSGQVDPEDSAYANLVLIAPNHIESGTGRLISTESAAEQAAESGKYWCDAGDVIYSKIRPALRKATLAPLDCLCSADMYPLKGLGPLSNEYLYWYLLSEPFSDFAVQESMRVAMPKLNRETLADAAIPLPSPAEQAEIVAFVKRTTAAVDDLTLHVTEHIDRLREYRSSLISAAVTGQLDMSTAVSNFQ